MAWMRRGLLGLVLVLGLVRALVYLAVAVQGLAKPLEAYHLEGKMVLLALRAERGLSLYPAWRTYPYVSNFYGPVYFALVGRVGAWMGADIERLFLIGRVVSFASGVLTAAVLGWAVGRRSGRGAGWVAAILSLGAAPMWGFSQMVRPDLLAELLGLVGFLLLVSRTAWVRAAGVAVLILAALTKQTIILFLLAGVLAWWVRGEWWRGVRLLVGGLVGLAVVVGGMTLGFEPNLAPSLLGEGKAPWSLYSWHLTVDRIVGQSPDLLLVPVLGLILWCRRGADDAARAWAVLSVVLLGSSVVLAAKRGSDLNYLLSLRIAEAFAFGSLWASPRAEAGGNAGGARRPGWGGVLALALAALSLVPGAVMTVLRARAEQSRAAFFASPMGHEVLDFHRALFRMAGDPKVRLLTDSSLLDLYQGDQAVFGDPFLCRYLDEMGQIDTTWLQGQIEARAFDWIITTSELDRPNYDRYDFGLPQSIVPAARRNYVRIDARAGFFLFRPRPRGPL